MFFIPVPVKILFADFPSEVSMYTISGSHSYKGFYDMTEKYIIFPLDNCPEIKQGSEIISSNGTVFIAKNVETGGCGPIADSLIVHV